MSKGYMPLPPHQRSTTRPVITPEGINRANLHAQGVDALQRWIWQCVVAGWDPMGDPGDFWSHDDNLAVQHLRWALIRTPHSELYDLVCLDWGLSPSQTYKAIVRMAPVDNYCAKAVSILSKQRLMFPEYRFAFLERSHDKNSEGS